MPNVKASVGSFTVTSATQFAVTDATAFGGDTPKGVLFWTGNHAVGTISDHAHFGLWGATADDLVGSCMRYRHDFSTSQVNRTIADGNVGAAATALVLSDISTATEMVLDANGDGIGSNPGPITDGWRFDVTSFSGGSVTVNYLLVGGDDLEIKATSRGVNDATELYAHGFSKTDAVLGFAWEANEFASGGNHTRTSSYNSYGCFATNDGGTTFDQWAVSQREVSGSSAQDIIGAFSNLDCINDSSVDSGHNTANTRQYRATGLDSTNLEITNVLGAFGSSPPILFLWMISIPSTLNVWVGDYALPTSGGTFTPSSQPGFEPGVYGIMASGHTTANDWEQVEGSGAWSFGVQDEFGNHKSASIIVEGEMLTSENTFAKSLTSNNFLDHNTVSGSSVSSAAVFTAATFISTGIEVASPTGTFGGLAGAFAFETATTAPVDKTSTDTLSFTDTATSDILFNRTVSESLVLADTAVGVGPIQVSVTETLVLTDDTVELTPPNVFSGILTEALVFSDSALASGIAPVAVGGVSGMTIPDVRTMRRKERLQVLARQDQALLEFLRKELSRGPRQ